MVSPHLGDILLGAAGLLEQTVRVEADNVVNQPSLEHGYHQVRGEGEYSIKTIKLHFFFAFFGDIK